MGGPDDQLGRVIAQRYRVEQVLGRGGMAIVYRVLDERTQQQLALKRCHARERSKLARYGLLLEREYHTLAQLAHPNIIAVHDFGVDRELPYYTMELLDGGDLASLERVPWQTTCNIMYDVASALAMLHSRGLLHRDVTIRNVHWSANQRAKLIDFGAMTTMGVGKDMVGTPPFVAPEVMQLQALDGRADIFSLGALGYRLLTGRHAFPARRFSELRDVWRSKPVAPSAIDPDLPAELSSLVLRMLSLERGGRVHTATEVIEKLRAIAHIERDDAAEISRAYLTTPTLVGREPALLLTRRHVLSLVRGDGGLLFVRGAAGSGRSRMLEACALEGKLLGAAVVRADARDGSEGEWGVARAIGEQLITQFPKHAHEAARLSRSVLGQLFEQLRSDEPVTVTAHVPDRTLIIRELRDWVLSLAKAQRLVILVDDIERVDEGSLAVLTAIAHKLERHALLLVLTASDDQTRPLPPALQMLAGPKNTLELDHLDADETLALVRSLFGDVEHVQLCAARIHGLSQGNPRATMELAQHLVDTRRARYEAGSWVLPMALDARDLPSNWTASLLARLNELGACARELADALALADADALPIRSFPALTGRSDVKEVFRAVDELVAARIVIADSERCYFAQRGFISVLEDALSSERRETLHARIALLLERTGGDIFRRAHHLFAAQLDKDALQLLLRMDLNAQDPPALLMITAIERAERLDMPASVLHRLRMSFLIAAPWAMEHATFRRIAPIVLAQLEQDSGLLHYRQLGHLPEDQRIAQALAQAQQAYSDTPEHKRVHTVIESIRELARLSGAISSMSLPVFDLDMLNSLPDLTPLFPLSPSLVIVGQFVEGSREWVRGRFHRTRELMRGVLERLDQPDSTGFDAAQLERMRLGMHSLLGLFEGSFGMEGAEQRAEILDERRAWRVNAWRVRAILRLSTGDVAEAGKCLRRAELLQIQEGIQERFTHATTGIELVLRSALGDLLGVKSLRPRLTHLASQYPAWRAVELLGRSNYTELQGDLQAALDLTLEGLAMAPPLVHPFFAALAGRHVALLSQLGRDQEAKEVGVRYLELCVKEQLNSADLRLRTAGVLARLNECDEAVRVLQPVLELAEREGRIGFALGIIYEMRARVALAARDRENFELYSTRCAREYEKSHNPVLGAQLGALMDQAREANLLPPLAEQLLRSLQPRPQEREFETLHSRIEECVDRADRGRCALTLLLQNAASSLGYLYGLGEDQSITLLAALPDPPADNGLADWVRQQAEQWLHADVTQAEQSNTVSSEQDAESGTEHATLTGDSSPDESRVFIDGEGRPLEAALLVDGSARAGSLAAILVLEHVPRQRAHVPATLSAFIATELIAHGDAKGWRVA